MSTKTKTTEDKKDKFVIIHGEGDQQIVAKVLRTNNRQKTTMVEYGDRKQWLPTHLLTPVVESTDAANDSDKSLFDKSAALGYLSAHIDTTFTQRMYLYHNQQKRLVPDGYVGDSPYFYKGTLDAFLEKWRADGITIQEAADKYNVAVSAVRHHIRDKNVDHIGKRGHARVYDPDDIAALFTKA